MMSYIFSTWRITWKSVVLLDFGDWMTEEPDATQRRATSIQDYLGATHALPWDEGNISHAIRFSRVRPHVTASSGRAFLLSALVTLPTGEGDALIEVQNGSSYTLAHAALSGDVAGRIVTDSEVLHSFTLEGSTLTLNP